MPLPATPPPPAPAVAVAPIAAYFKGAWSCRGAFSNGKPISATIRFESDVEGAAVVVHHDDTPALGFYHSIEVWGYSKPGGTYVAALYDAYGGIRTFSSPGWSGDTLTWTIVNPPDPSQQFVYTKKDATTFTVDWKIMRNGAYIVGDTLTCKPL
jgi:hypothetical protein